MIYSEKYKFCFIHIEKCAGTSIRDTLAKELKIKHTKNLFYFGPMKGKGGQTVKDYIKIFGYKKYKEFFSFAFVRNPFERFVSWYLYDKMGFDNFEKWLYNFLENNKLNQLDYLTNNDGFIDIEFIGRYENLQNDFNYILNRLGLNKIILPIKNKNKKNYFYQDFYSKNLELYVKSKIQKELDFFNYKFNDR